MKFAGFEIDAVRGELRFEGQPVPMQEQLLKLLALLLDNPGEVVSRERIRLRLWGDAQGDPEHRINTAIGKLRKTLTQHDRHHQVSILTSAGEGYRLRLPGHRTLQQVAPDTSAYDAFLTGRFLFSQRNPSALLAARQHFEFACERDPDFALAHASLSRTCRFLTIFETASPGPLWEQAEKHANLAVQLDPQLSEAHAAVACVLARYRWQWQQGCLVYQQALHLKPDDPETLCDFGVALLAMGCFDDGVARLERALTLDPRHAVGRATVALGWLMQGKKAEALAMLTGMTIAMPDFLTAWIYLGIEQLNQGDWAKSEQSCRHMLQLAPGLPTFLGLLAHAEAGLGRRSRVAAIATQLEHSRETRYVSPTSLAMVKLAAGDIPAARHAVAQAVPERDANFAMYRGMRLFDPIRRSPEFRQALKVMQLTDPRADETH